jgi:hypothetical protein
MIALLRAAVLAIVLTGTVACSGPRCESDAKRTLQVLDLAIKDSLSTGQIASKDDHRGCDSGDSPAISIILRPQISLTDVVDEMKQHGWHPLSPQEAPAFVQDSAAALTKNVNGKVVIATFTMREASKYINVSVP